MRKVCSMLIGFLLVGSVYGASQDGDDDWVQKYYLNPSPQKFKTEVSKLQAAGAFSIPNAFYPTTAFFSHLISDNPEMFNEWKNLWTSFPFQDQKVFIFACRWSQLESAQTYLDQCSQESGDLGQYCRQARNSNVPDLRKIDYPSPEDLDACWGSFFATGDPTYVDAVIRCATMPVKKGSINLSQRVAQWSLKSLSQDHPAVLKAKDDFYVSASNQEKEALREIFEEKAKP